jgi:sulfur carrier protein ThiS adenylyltransferase
MDMPTRQELREAFVSRHGSELQRKLDRSVVAICGLGGLGSNIAIALTRAGVCKLILTDYDKVDITNIHRQQYYADQIGMYKTEAIKDNLKRINPYMELELNNIKISEDNIEELLGKADIICEAFDKADQKAMLVNFVLEHFPEKYLVAGSGMAGLDSVNLIKTREITKHFIICGDGNSDVNTSGSLMASRVMACASHEAHAVIQIINKNT